MHPAIRFCRSRDGARIAYATFGDGPPLLQTPTWLTHLELDWKGVTWRPWLDELGRHHRIVRYDLRGCGLSDRDVADLSLDAWVADLEAVVEATGLQRFTLVGHCQGGTIAAAYAARHPQRLERLLLHGSYVQGGLACPWNHAAAGEIESLGHLIASGWGRRTPAYRELFACMLMPTAQPEKVRSLAEMERECASAENATRLWRAFHQVDISHEAPRIRTPTLVAHSREDGMVPFAEGCRLASLIPDAQFLPLESSNHILQPEEPAWERFWQEAHAFLAAGSGVARDSGEAFPDLTRRERDVLHQIALGKSNADIADSLDIRPKTVRNHITNIFSKLAVEHRPEAIVRAREAGFGRDTGS